MSPWIGSWGEGARYSDAQLYEMVVRGLSPDTAEAIRVMRPASRDETWWGVDLPAPIHEYDCPVLGRRADGRIKILAPAGIAKLVLADGWTHHPKKARGWGRVQA